MSLDLLFFLKIFGINFKAFLKESSGFKCDFMLL